LEPGRIFANHITVGRKEPWRTTIGIVRRTYPKKTNFDLVSAKDVKRLERKLNNTPRKILHYLTPKEVFDKIVALPR